MSEPTADAFVEQFGASPVCRKESNHDKASHPCGATPVLDGAGDSAAGCSVGRCPSGDTDCQAGPGRIPGADSAIDSVSNQHDPSSRTGASEKTA
jgi:hypothetical protein